MEDKIEKCRITKYDASITKPPYETVDIGTMEVIRPKIDEGGVLFADNLREGCRKQGHDFKFYTSSSKDEFDYEVVVYGDYEENNPPKKDILSSIMDLQNEILVEQLSNDVRNRLKNQ